MPSTAHDAPAGGDTATTQRQQQQQHDNNERTTQQAGTAVTATTPTPAAAAPLLRLASLPLSAQFQRIEREYAALEEETMDAQAYDFTTALRHVTRNRYINVLANECSLFPPPPPLPPLPPLTTTTTTTTTTSHADTAASSSSSTCTPPSTAQKATTTAAASAYINANVIDLGVPPRFVACQAPPPDVIADFYRALCAHKITLVLMLTSLSENGLAKADCYWPSDADAAAAAAARRSASVRFDDVCVRTDVDEPYTHLPALHLTVRPLRITCNHNSNNNNSNNRGCSIAGSDEGGTSAKRSASVNGCADVTHKVVQVQYTGWPDQGVPPTTAAFDYLLQMLHDHVARARTAGSSNSDDNNNSNNDTDSGNKGEATTTTTAPPSPVLVHCSAGIGRTGTLIGAYAAIAHVQRGTFGETTMRDVVCAMRRARYGMVQRVEQYMYMYQIVLHHVGVDVSAFAAQLQGRAEEYQQRLMQMRLCVPRNYASSGSNNNSNNSRGRNIVSMPLPSATAAAAAAMAGGGGKATVVVAANATRRGNARLSPRKS